MTKRFYETSTHSDFYAQCRPTYPVDIIDKIVDYLSLKVESSLKVFYIHFDIYIVAHDNK
jgi:hypothetical protein